jgi:hypothetical protein
MCLMLRYLRKWLSSKAFTSRRPETAQRLTATRVRPALEPLEDRNLLSAFALRAGSAGFDTGNSVATDAQGDIYVGGHLEQITADVAGAQVFNGGWLAKYSPGGTLLWSQRIAGNLHADSVGSVAVDSQGNVYATGVVLGTADLGQGHVLETQAGSLGNSFVEKLDSSGNILWAQKIESPLWGESAQLAVDAAGNVYTVGVFQSSANFFGTSLTSLSVNNEVTGWLMKQDTSGNLVWLRQFGTHSLMGATEATVPTSLAVNPAGSAIYVGGGFAGGGVDFGTGSPLPLSAQGQEDLFVERFGSGGAAVWAVDAGSPTPMGFAQTSNIALDAGGTLYLSGTIRGTVNFGATQLSSTTDAAVVAKVNPTNGAFLRATAFAGSGVDFGGGITVGPDGNLYATGSFSKTASFGPNTLTSLGQSDIYVAKLDTNLHVLAVSQMGGGPIQDAGHGIAVDTIGYVDTTGFFGATGQFDGTALTSAGSDDIFLTHTKYIGPTTHASVIGHILDIQVDDGAHEVAIVDEGGGRVSVAFDRMEAEAFAGITAIKVRTGDGSDVVRYASDPDDLLANFDVKLGDGSNKVSMMLSPGMAAHTHHAGFKAHIMAGAGTDTVDMMIGGSMDRPAVLDGRVAIRFDAGPGMDTLDVTYRNVTIVAPQMIRFLDARPGDDFDVFFRKVIVAAPIRIVEEMAALPQT